VTDLTPEAIDLVSSVGMKDCPAPIVFAVTNFDPSDTAMQVRANAANGILK
jgi:hypothetical protein